MIFKHRPVYISVSGESDDIMIEEAYFEDTGDELTEDEIEELTATYGDALYMEYMDYSIGRSDWLSDLAKDN